MQLLAAASAISPRAKPGRVSRWPLYTLDLNRWRNSKIYTKKKTLSNILSYYILIYI